MLDSTIVMKVGKYLAPDEKIQEGSTLFQELISSDSFKKSFKRLCKRQLALRRGAVLGGSAELKPREYYARFKRVNLGRLRGKVETKLIRSSTAKEGPKVSSMIEERISKLEFLFKRIGLSRGVPPGNLN